jgi:hypothetical protein
LVTEETSVTPELRTSCSLPRLTLKKPPRGG